MLDLHALYSFFLARFPRIDKTTSFLLPSQTGSSPWTTAVLWKTRKPMRYQSASLLFTVRHSSCSSPPPTLAPSHAGHALRGEAQHVCERHHQLWHLPLQPRHLPAHRHRLPEEPAGHVAVSWLSCWGTGGGVTTTHFPGFVLFHLSFFLPFIVFLFGHTTTRYPYDG